jgi:excisionase family DNA binding protein
MQFNPTYSQRRQRLDGVPQATYASTPPAAPAPRPFLSVAEAAPMLRLSEMTLYRAIHDGQFPAVRIRGRLIIPTRAIEEMIDAAVADGAMVDAADWVRDDPRTAS